jgi:hypothetical protein
MLERRVHLFYLQYPALVLVGVCARPMIGIDNEYEVGTDADSAG